MNSNGSPATWPSSAPSHPASAPARLANVVCRTQPVFANPWFLNFMVRLLQGRTEVLSLLRHNPFPGYPRASLPGGGLPGNLCSRVIDAISDRGCSRNYSKAECAAGRRACGHTRTEASPRYSSTILSLLGATRHTSVPLAASAPVIMSLTLRREHGSQKRQCPRSGRHHGSRS